jgi:hypothetical protein
VVRRRDRLLVAMFWARDTCVSRRCLFYLRIIPYLAQPPSIFGSTTFLSTISFHNFTDADVFLSSALTLRLFDYPSIPLDPMT